MRLIRRRDLNSHIAKPPPLIEGVLDRGVMAVLEGPWGSGKTFLALDWAGTITTGRPWHGHHTTSRDGRALVMDDLVEDIHYTELGTGEIEAASDDPRLYIVGDRVIHDERQDNGEPFAFAELGPNAYGQTVVYVAAEGEHGIRQRVEAWEQVNGATMNTLLLWDSKVNLLSRDAVGAFMREVQTATEGEDLGLIVLDTFSRCAVGNESGPEFAHAVDMLGEIRRTAARLNPDYPPSVLVLHHPDKKGTGSRGLGTLEDNADQIFRLRGKVGKRGGTVLVRDKSKDSATELAEPFRFRLRDVGSSVVLERMSDDAPDVEPDSERPATGSRRDVTSPARARELIAAMPAPVTRADAVALLISHGWKRRTAYRHVGAIVPESANPVPESASAN